MVFGGGGSDTGAGGPPQMATRTRRGSIIGMFTKSKEETSDPTKQPNTTRKRGSILGRRASVSEAESSMSAMQAAAAAAAAAAALQSGDSSRQQSVNSGGQQRRRGSITGMFGGGGGGGGSGGSRLDPVGGPPAGGGGRRGSFTPSKESMAKALANAEQKRRENDAAVAAKKPATKAGGKVFKKAKGELKLRAMGQKWRKKFVLIVSRFFPWNFLFLHDCYRLSCAVAAWQENAALYIGPGPQGIRQQEQLDMKTARVGRVEKFGFALQYTSESVRLGRAVMLSDPVDRRCSVLLHGVREILQFQAMDGKAKMMPLFIEAIKDASRHYESSSDEDDTTSGEDSSDEDEDDEDGAANDYE